MSERIKKAKYKYSILFVLNHILAIISIIHFFRNSNLNSIIMMGVVALIYTVIGLFQENEISAIENEEYFNKD